MEFRPHMSSHRCRETRVATTHVATLLAVVFSMLSSTPAVHGQTDETSRSTDTRRAGDAPLDKARFPVEPSLSAWRTDMLEPSWVWQSWRLQGRGIAERELAILRTFLERELRKYKVMDKDAREHMRKFVGALGYYLVSMTIDVTSQGRIAILHVEPGTWVRRVRINVPLNGVTQLGTIYHIFESEVARRMSLKAGSRLHDDPGDQDEQLRIEASRLESYLRTQGYFEACVEIICKSGRKSGIKYQPRCANPDQDRPAEADVCQGTVELSVKVHKGPLYRLGKIDVVGNQEISTETIVSLFRHNCFFDICPFNPFHFQTMKRDLDRVVELYQRRGFPAVRVSSDYDPKTSYDKVRERVDFTITINERRRLEVEFEGNRPPSLTEERLRSLLTFNDEGSYDDIELAASANAIRRDLQSRGFFETNVTFHRERLNTVDYITFSMYPGARMKVDSVSFEGNRALSSEALARVVDSKVGNYLSTGQLETDVERLLEYYRQRGFREAVVRSRVSRAREDRDNAAVLAALVASGAASSGLRVAFQVEEGPRTLIQGIDFHFTCEHRFSAQQLARVVSLEPGDPYTVEGVERGQKELARFYFEKAYPQARITTDPNAKDPENRCEQTEGRVRYCICENNKVRIGKVLIQGNFKTDEWVLRDELGFTEGKDLTLRAAEEGPQNLRTTGLFNAVQVNFVDLGKTSDEDINVLVRVQERHDYKVSGEVALGYSTDAKEFAELGAVAPNLFGQGLRVSLRGQYGRQFKSLEAKFNAPRWVMRRLVKLPWNLDTNAFWRQEDTERFGILSSVGTGAGISKLFRRGTFADFLFAFRYDFRQRNRNEPLVRGPGPSEDLEKAPVETRTGAVGVTLIVDKRRDRQGRPNPLTPDAGYKLEFSAQLASTYLLGQDNFVKLGTGGQIFWRPSGRLLFSNSVRYDQGVPFDSVVLPEVERYFAGGDTTVRGFEEDRLATEIIEEPLPPYGTITQLRVLPVGGNMRFIHNLDLQMNLWELGGAPVASAIFLDTGLVTNSFDNFELTQLRHALGVALARWVHPFGSVSIEWAIPLDPDVGDNPRGRFHFNFGLLF